VNAQSISPDGTAFSQCCVLLLRFSRGVVFEEITRYSIQASSVRHSFVLSSFLCVGCLRQFTRDEFIRTLKRCIRRSTYLTVYKYVVVVPSFVTELLRLRQIFRKSTTVPHWDGFALPQLRQIFRLEVDDVTQVMFVTVFPLHAEVNICLLGFLPSFYEKTCVLWGWLISSFCDRLYLWTFRLKMNHASRMRWEKK
jgi:hypothetical protein